MVQSDWPLKSWGPTIKSWVYADMCVFPENIFSFVCGNFPFSLESVKNRFTIPDMMTSSLPKFRNLTSSN